MHLLRLEIFCHSVNMTIKLWPQACLLSADDPVCIKAESGGKYNNRWREMEKSRERTLCHVGRRWKERRGRERRVKNKQKKDIVHQVKEQKNKRKSTAARQGINSVTLCGGQRAMDVEKTHFSFSIKNSCLPRTCMSKQHVTPICIVSLCGHAAWLKNAGLCVHECIHACMFALVNSYLYACGECVGPCACPAVCYAKHLP